MIKAIAQQVWALYANVPGSVEWVPFVEEVLYVSAPAGLAQVYHERTLLGGISDVAEWKVIEWDPPRRQVQLSINRKMDSRLVIEVEPAQQGAGIRHAAVLRSQLPGPLGWLHEQFVAPVARRGIRQAANAAKRRLEANRTSPRVTYSSGDGLGRQQDRVARSHRRAPTPCLHDATRRR